jgi:hypothetical protein
MKKVLVLIVLAVLCAPTEAQYRARWSRPPGSSGGGEPTVPPVATELLSSSSTDAAASYSTTSASLVEHFGAPTFSCPTDSLCLAWVSSTDGDTDGPDEPATFTQTGQAWTLLDTAIESSLAIRQSLYYTIGTGATAAALSVTYADADAQTGIAFNVWEAENIDTSQGTSGIIRQNKQAQANRGSSLTTTGTTALTVSLADRTAGSLVLMGHARTAACTTLSAKAGYTEGTLASYAGPTTRTRVDYVVGGSDASPTVTVGVCDSNTIDWAGIAVELAPDTSVDATLPTVIITSPTIGETWNSSDASFNFGGSATDDDAVVSVTWACPTCTPTSGTATGTTSWSASTTIARSGGGTANVITVTAEDASANTSTDVITVTGFSADTIAPIVTVINPATSPSTGSNTLVTFNGTITDNVTVDRVDYAAVGATPSSGTASLLAGEWSFTLTVPCSAGGTSTTVNMTGYDVAGNPSVVQTRVRVCVSSGDVTIPSVTVTTNCGGGVGSNCTVTSSTATFSGTASDNVNVASVSGSCSTCTPSAWAATGTTTWTKTGIGLAEGANTLCAVATDAAGLQSAADCQVWTYVTPLSIATGSCPPAQEDVAYGACTIQYAGGDGGATWTQVGSNLNTGSCAGLTLAQVGQDAVVDGIPTAAAPTTCTFTLQVDDGDEQVQREFDITILAAGTGAHAYFTQITSLQEALAITGCTTEDAKGCSLRSQAQLDRLTPGTVTDGRGPWWSYDPGSDTHAMAQDAAKLNLSRVRQYETCDNDDLARGYALHVYGKAVFTGTPGAVVPNNTVLTKVSTGYTYRTANAWTLDATGQVKANIYVVTPVGQHYLAEIPNGTALAVTGPPAGVNATATIGSAGNDRVFVRCSDSIPGNQQIKIPVPAAYSDGNIVMVWDWFSPPEWRTTYGTMGQFKFFQIRSGATLAERARWGTIRWRWSDADPSDPTMLGSDDQPWDSAGTSPGSTPEQFIDPTGLGAELAKTWQYKHSMWIRMIVELKLQQEPEVFTEYASMVCTGVATAACPNGTVIKDNPSDPQGQWHMVSMWYLDESGRRATILYRVPITTPAAQWPYVTSFDYELNTSEAAPSRNADWTGWTRNVIFLRNYTIPNSPFTDTVLFQNPIR